MDEEWNVSVTDKIISNFTINEAQQACWR